MSLSRLLIGSVLLMSSFVVAQDYAQSKPSKPKAAGAKVVVSKAYYPSNTCIITDRALKPGKSVTTMVEGRAVKTCCKKCAAKVKADPARWLTKLDSQIIAAQKASYPLKTCPVSHEGLGKKPKDVVIDGHLVRVCCKKCIAPAKKNAAKVIASINAALVAAHGNGAATCPVSGKALKANKGINLVYGESVVRLCCKRCVQAVEKSPQKFLTAMHAKPEHGESHEKGEHEHGKVHK